MYQGDIRDISTMPLVFLFLHLPDLLLTEKSNIIVVAEILEGLLWQDHFKEQAGVIDGKIEFDKARSFTTGDMNVTY